MPIGANEQWELIIDHSSVNNIGDQVHREENLSQTTAMTLSSKSVMSRII
jgi:hypothetical protein